MPVAFLLRRNLHARTPVAVPRLRGEAMTTTHPAPWRCTFAGTPEECVAQMHARAAIGGDLEWQVVEAGALSRYAANVYAAEAKAAS